MREEINKNKNITSNSVQLEILKTHFPQCFDKDGRFCPERLEEIARGSGANISRESFKLDWVGKSYALLLANQKTETFLAPNNKHNTLPLNANSENLLIQGDNLDVLKHLVSAYSEKVKMIYIDPPYNTGSDGFIYNDNRIFTVSELQRLAGVDEDEAKRILDFTSSSSNSHSAWLTFMYPRLYVAHKLLRDDGVIFISIDENEQSQLKLLCNEIFGEENFVAEFVWKSRQIIDSRNKSKASVDHETVLAFAKKIDGFSLKGKRIDLKKYTNPDNDKRGPWMSNSILGLANSSQRPNLHYKISDPKDGREFDCPPESGWRYSTETMRKKIKDGRIIFPRKDDGRPREKKYVNELENQFTGFSSILPPEAGFTLNGSREVRDLFDDKYFDFPKPTSLISKLIEQGISDSKSAIVLDFFSGSGTTAHAVMSLNAKDCGNRKHISVQLDEPTDKKSEAHKAGYKTIFEITRERVIRAATKIKSDYPNAKCDFGFKEFKTIPANKGPFKGYLDDAATIQDYVSFNGMALDDDAIYALLTTWQAFDGIPLHELLKEIDLNGYTGYMGRDIIYFVNRGLEIKHITSLLNLIDEDENFTPRKIVVFHYRFNDKQLREFSEAVNAPNRKHLQLEFVQRF
jgi:adenine-specific DNA-methyltransferase